MINILIVDDNPAIRNGLCTIISMQDSYQVIGECTDGDEVLPFLRTFESTVDIIIMDISMKRMDGIEATKLVLGEFPDQKIIVLTMHDQETYFEGVLESGAMAYLLKNVELCDLFDAIENAMKGVKTFNPL